MSAASTLRSLVVPLPGTRPCAPLFGRYLAKTYELFLTLGPALPARKRSAHTSAVNAARRAASANLRATLSCFASPTVGTPLHCLRLREALPEFRTRIDAAIEAVSPHVLFELAQRGLLPEETRIDWPCGAPPLATLSAGVVLNPPADATGLRFSRRRVEALGSDGATLAVARFEDAGHIEAEGFDLRHAYRTVGRIARLALIDHNPLAAFEAHPDKSGNHVDLGGRPEHEWTAALDEAFALVETHLPEIFAEMGMLLHEVVPVGFDAERHLSASYREAIGTVYLTLHPQVMTMAEALVHEFQHNKLNLASYEWVFLRNAYAPRYRSPVRPDPRPLWGILLAVHAFLPVAVLYRRMRKAGHPRAQAPDFARRLSEIDLKNHEGMEMLRAHGDWTDEGRMLMEELDALDRAHMAEHAAQGLPLVPQNAHED